MRVGHFITIDVAPEHRRAGLGRLLMQTAEQHLASGGCTSVMLEVGMSNLSAQAFYHRMGYHSTGRIPGYYADGTEALVMRRALSSDEVNPS